MFLIQVLESVKLRTGLILTFTNIKILLKI